MYIYAFLCLGVLMLVFIGSYLWNKNTPKPDGCEEPLECGGCPNMTCSHHHIHQKEEKTNEF